MFDKAKTRPPHAVWELVSNGLNGGGPPGLATKFKVVSVYPKENLFEPSKDDGLFVFSNTHITQSHDAYKKIINLGSSGEGTRTDNYYGLGIKEFCASFKGRLALACATHSTDSKWTVMGIFMLSADGNDKFFQGMSQVDQKYAFFEVEINLDGSESSIVYPRKSDCEAERLLLDCCLPFCKSTAHSDRERACENEKFFLANMYGLVNKMNSWCERHVDRLVDAGFARDEVSPHFESVVVSGAFGIDPELVQEVDVDGLHPSHKWFVPGTSNSMSTLVASKIDFDHYVRNGYKVRVEIGDEDVQEGNPELPLALMQRWRIKDDPDAVVLADGRSLNAWASDSITDEDSKSFRMCTPAIIGSRQIEINGRGLGVPKVVMTAAGGFKLVSGLTSSRPLSGVVLTMDGVVLNGLHPGAAFTPSDLFCGIDVVAESVRKAFVQHDSLVEQSVGGVMAAPFAIAKAILDLHGVDICMSTDSTMKKKACDNEKKRRVNEKLNDMGLVFGGHLLTCDLIYDLVRSRCQLNNPKNVFLRLLGLAAAVQIELMPGDWTYADLTKTKIVASDSQLLHVICRQLVATSCRYERIRRFHQNILTTNTLRAIAHTSRQSKRTAPVEVLDDDEQVAIAAPRVCRSALVVAAPPTAIRAPVASEPPDDPTVRAKKALHKMVSEMSIVMKNAFGLQQCDINKIDLMQGVQKKGKPWKSTDVKLIAFYALQHHIVQQRPLHERPFLRMVLKSWSDTFASFIDFKASRGRALPPKKRHKNTSGEATRREDAGNDDDDSNLLQDDDGVFPLALMSARARE